jgi:hypothetical protein
MGTLFLALLTLGCGVNYSMTGVAIPAYAKTFSVQYFQASAPLAVPTLNQSFTDDLRNYVVSHSRLVLVTNGDVDFAGSITGYSLLPVAATSQNTGQSTLTRLTITVDVTYTDKNDSKKSYSSSFSRYADYPSAQSFSSVQDGLIQKIDDQLVEDIFDKAFNNW